MRNSIYKQIHLTPCASCGAKPKARSAYYRHSPNAEQVSKHFQDAGFDITLAPNDTICKSCYDSHRVILEAKHTTPTLQAQIRIWREELRVEEQKSLTAAILDTVIFVGRKLQEDRALLLPRIATFFLNRCPAQSENLEVEDGTINFSSRWLMHQLIKYLEPYMNYRSVIKKLGTLLYPKTSNVLRCLTLALHEMDTVHGYDNSGVEDKEILLKRSGNMVNDLLHDEITKLKSRQIDLTSFDLSSSISSTNNLLWQFICSCTQSVRERTGRKNQDDAHVKTVRRFFLICMMRFTTNPQCYTELHQLVAEAVEVQGGSRKLIKLLNRLGVSVSVDTHDEFVTDVAEKEKEKGIWNQLLRFICTFFSADNLDFLQRHAAVYCGDQTRSYHGTTLQVTKFKIAAGLHLSLTDASFPGLTFPFPHYRCHSLIYHGHKCIKHTNLKTWCAGPIPNQKLKGLGSKGQLCVHVVVPSKVIRCCCDDTNM